MGMGISVWEWENLSGNEQIHVGMGKSGWEWINLGGNGQILVGMGKPGCATFCLSLQTNPKLLPRIHPEAQERLKKAKKKVGNHLEPQPGDPKEQSQGWGCLRSSPNIAAKRRGLGFALCSTDGNGAMGDARPAPSGADPCPAVLRGASESLARLRKGFSWKIPPLLCQGGP